MISAEGEKVPFSAMVDPKGKNVEHWMMEVEDMMKLSIRDIMERYRGLHADRSVSLDSKVAGNVRTQRQSNALDA